MKVVPHLFAKTQTPIHSQNDKSDMTTAKSGMYF